MRLNLFQLGSTFSILYLAQSGVDAVTLKTDQDHLIADSYLDENVRQLSQTYGEQIVRPISSPPSHDSVEIHARIDAKRGLPPNSGFNRPTCGGPNIIRSGCVPNAGVIRRVVPSQGITVIPASNINSRGLASAVNNRVQ